MPLGLTRGFHLTAEEALLEAGQQKPESLPERHRSQVLQSKIKTIIRVLGKPRLQLDLVERTIIHKNIRKADAASSLCRVIS